MASLRMLQADLIRQAVSQVIALCGLASPTGGGVLPRIRTYP